MVELSDQIFCMTKYFVWSNILSDQIFCLVKYLSDQIFAGQVGGVEEMLDWGKVGGAGLRQVSANENPEHVDDDHDDRNDHDDHEHEGVDHVAEDYHDDNPSQAFVAGGWEDEDEAQERWQRPSSLAQQQWSLF